MATGLDPRYNDSCIRKDEIVTSRALFLDRDGIINIDSGFVGTRERFVFRDGIFDFIREAQNKLYVPIVITNQSGVGRAYYSEQDFRDLNNWMIAEMADRGIRIADVYACFNHPKAVNPEHQDESFWRKPNPGMILQAAVDHSIDLSRSLFIGDRITDMVAATSAGVGIRLWLPEEGKQAEPFKDCIVVSSFAEAAKYLSAPVEGDRTSCAPQKKSGLYRHYTPAR